MIHHECILCAIIGLFSSPLHHLVEPLKAHAPEPSERAESKQIYWQMRDKMMLRLPQPDVLANLQ